MAGASKQSAPSPLDLGWTELDAGRWSEARALFDEALQAAETPAAFEGLSWAAWWLDDAATVFHARARAHRLYEDAGDLAGAARMATWVACDELDFHGAVAVASGWLQRAGRLLDALEPAPEHGWLAFFQGYMAHATGDVAAAAELGRRCAELGRRFDVPDLEMLGLALEGSTLVESGRVDEGMRCLDEATAGALQGDAAIPISAAWTCCFLVTACAATRDYERAAEWCDRIAEFADRYGSRYMLAFCRGEYGAVYLWRGRWADAEAVLAASIEDFVRSRPAMVAGSLVGLAELRRRQGRADEAAVLLDRAGPVPAAQRCRAHLALDRAEVADALDLTQRYLRQVPDQRRLDRVPGLELLVRGHTIAGQLEAAGAAVDALREIASLVGTDAARASLDFAEALVAAAGGFHDRARPLFEDAIDRFERAGGAFAAAEAQIELATTLLALGRSDQARREAAAALRRLTELGAAPAAARARALLEGPLRSDDAGPPLPELTSRERQVLRLVAAGLTNRQIAEQLTLSEHTVHRHVTNILRKLDLPSRTAAAALAARLGLLDDPTA